MAEEPGMPDEAEAALEAELEGEVEPAPGGDGEDPPPPSEEYIEKLLKAANEAAGPARNSWIAFLGLATYLVISLSDITHAELLALDSEPIVLPIISAPLSFAGFMWVAPILFFVAHLVLLVQHVLLARKYSKFLETLAAPTAARNINYPYRELVHSYMFAQLIAGPTPPLALGMSIRLIAFSSLALFPLLALLYFQIVFLPVHAQDLTWAHQFLVLFDAGALVVFVYLINLQSSTKVPEERQFSLHRLTWPKKPSAMIYGGLILMLVPFSSIFIVTTPGGVTDRLTANIPWLSTETDSGRAFWPTAILFEENRLQFEINPSTGARTAGRARTLFSRSLVVDAANRSRIQLAARDLRNATLGGIDLDGADLFSANLRNASLFGTTLVQANMAYTDMGGADLTGANLQGADLTGAILVGADLRFADLSNANLRGVDLRGADLSYSTLVAANLANANLTGANMYRSILIGAELSGARLHGTNMRFTKLAAANLHLANVHLLDLEGSQVWHTQAPIQGCDGGVSSMSGVIIDDIGLSGSRFLGELLSSLEPRDEHSRQRLERVQQLLDSEAQVWGGENQDSEQQYSRQCWEDLENREVAPTELSEQGQLLASLACASRGELAFSQSFLGAWTSEVGHAYVEAVNREAFCPNREELLVEADWQSFEISPPPSQTN